MWSRAARIIASVLVIGCATESTTTPGSPTVTRLALSAVSLLAGDSVVPTIQVTIGGETRPATANEVVVTSSDTSVVVIATNDALIAVGDGQADVTIAWAATPSIAVTRTITITSEHLSGVRLIASASMVSGDSAPYGVTGLIRDGRVIVQPVAVTVASRNPAVVTASNGLAIANAAGQAWLAATTATGVADSVLVTVAPGPPAHLTISPEIATVATGQVLRLSVTSMSDRRGNAIANLVPTFMSTAPGVATVQADGTVTAIGAGSVLIVAAAGSAVDTLRLAVTTPSLQRLSPTPDSVTLHPGDTSRVVVRAFDTQGNPMTLPPLTWASFTGGITVSGTGLIAASSSIVGTIPNGVVQVVSGAVTAQVRIAVVPLPPPSPPVLQQLVVTPDSVTLNPGAAVQIRVQAFDTRAVAMSLPVLAWQSLTSGIAVSGTGVITASPGISSTIPNGRVQVSSGSITATVRVAVVAVPPPPASDGGYVQVRWVGGTPSPAVAAAFEAARTRINGLFNSFNGVSPLDLNVAASTCMTGAPALAETVRGIVIFAQVAPIDGVGGILGSAGPCLIRSGTRLPVVAAMQFDSADMNTMLANGLLNGVVLHEMMHTLGFGTIWGPGLQDEVAAPSGSDPRYLAPTGQAAYAALGAADAAIGVPVENTGGSGTRGSHWRESVFHTELMTGWADGTMPMSQVTVGALKDFGYDVDLTKADPFVLAGSILGAGLRASQLIVEQTKTPIGVVGPGGQITPYGGPTAH